MGDHEKHQAEKGIGQQVNRIRGGEQRENGAVEENSSRSLVQYGREKEIPAGGQEHAYERQKIGGRDHAAFFFGARAMLDQRVERHGEKAAEEAEEPEIGDPQAHDVHDERADVLRKRDAGVRRRYLQPSGQSFGGALEIEERAEERHADGAERNQSIFNFPAGKIASGETAEADADSQRGLQVAD